jgi:hypothetical protein
MMTDKGGLITLQNGVPFQMTGNIMNNSMVGKIQGDLQKVVDSVQRKSNWLYPGSSSENGTCTALKAEITEKYEELKEGFKSCVGCINRLHNSYPKTLKRINTHIDRNDIESGIVPVQNSERNDVYNVYVIDFVGRETVKRERFVAMFRCNKKLTLEKDMTVENLKLMFAEIFLYSLQNGIRGEAAKKMQNMVRNTLLHLEGGHMKPEFLDDMSRKCSFQYVDSDIQEWSKKHGMGSDMNSFACLLKRIDKDPGTEENSIKINVFPAAYAVADGKKRSLAFEMYEIQEKHGLYGHDQAHSGRDAVYIPHKSINSKNNVNMSSIISRMKELVSNNSPKMDSLQVDQFSVSQHGNESLGECNFLTTMQYKYKDGDIMKIGTIYHSLEYIKPESIHPCKREPRPVYDRYRENGWKAKTDKTVQTISTHPMPFQFAPPAPDQYFEPDSEFSKPLPVDKGNKKGMPNNPKPKNNRKDSHQPIDGRGYLFKPLGLNKSQARKAKQTERSGIDKQTVVSPEKKRRGDEVQEGEVQEGGKKARTKAEIQEYLQNLMCKFTRAQSKLNVEVRSSVEVPQRRTNVHELERLAKESLDVKKMTPNSLSVRESREAANAAGCMKEQVGALLIGCVAGAGRMFPQPA